MVQGCGNNFVKYSVIFVNVLVCIVGIAILATSLALVFNKTFQDDITKVIKNTSGNDQAAGTFASLQAVFYVTAAVGGLIFLTGFLGCCGAACESTCLLGIFFTIILLLFLTELGVGIAALVMQGSMQTAVNNYYNQTVVPEYIAACQASKPTDKQTNLISAWNSTQNVLKCCGCNSASDYPTQGAPHPNCPQYCYGGYTNGCCPTLWDDLKNGVAIIGGVAIGLLVVELLAMIFSCCMCSAIRSKYRNYS